MSTSTEVGINYKLLLLILILSVNLLGFKTNTDSSEFSGMEHRGIHMFTDPPVHIG